MIRSCKPRCPSGTSSRTTPSGSRQAPSSPFGLPGQILHVAPPLRARTHQAGTVQVAAVAQSKTGFLGGYNMAGTRLRGCGLLREGLGNGTPTAANLGSSSSRTVADWIGCARMRSGRKSVMRAGVGPVAPGLVHWRTIRPWCLRWVGRQYLGNRIAKRGGQSLGHVPLLEGWVSLGGELARDRRSESGELLLFPIVHSGTIRSLVGGAGAAGPEAWYAPRSQAELGGRTWLLMLPL